MYMDTVNTVVIKKSIASQSTTVFPLKDLDLSHSEMAKATSAIQKKKKKKKKKVDIRSYNLPNRPLVSTFFRNAYCKCHAICCSFAIVSLLCPLNSILFFHLNQEDHF